MNIKMQMEMGALRKELDELKEKVAKLEYSGSLDDGVDKFEKLSTEVRMIKARMGRKEPPPAV